jgi:hypothetical protein
MLEVRYRIWSEGNVQVNDSGVTGREIDRAAEDTIAATGRDG